MLHNIKHNKVLHELNMVAVVTRDIPYVAAEECIQVEKLMSISIESRYIMVLKISPIFRKPFSKPIHN